MKEAASGANFSVREKSKGLKRIIQAKSKNICQQNKNKDLTLACVNVYINKYNVTAPSLEHE